MGIRKAFFAMAASALVLGSTAATAAPAADLRTGSAIGEAESMGAGGGFGWIVALLIAAGVAGVIVADNDEDEGGDTPVSP